MESFKKFLPLLIIAIVFAVGGYFVGHSSLNNQGASFYKAVSTTTSITKPTGLGTTGPTGGDNPNAVWRVRWIDGTNGGCQLEKFDQGLLAWGPVGMTGFSKKDCHAMPTAPKDINSGIIAATNPVGQSAVSLSATEGGNNPASMEVVWVKGKGCLLLRDDGRWTTTSLSEKECVNFKIVTNVTNKN